jgi:uncharacterized membrane protein YgdD (TMEM256/DUF423 family)
MEYRIWLFVAALAGLTAVLIGAITLHGLEPKNPAIGAVTPIFNAGQLYHALHALALLGVAVLFRLSHDQRRPFGTAMLYLAAIGFAGGILLYSGGIYVGTHIQSVGSNIQGYLAANVRGVVVAGMLLFLAGWAALALSAFGLRGVTERSGG